MKVPTLSCISVVAAVSVAAAQQTPTAEQATLIRQAGCTMTQIVAVPIYHAEGRFINGRLNACSPDRPWLDISVGPNAPRPGEIFVFVYGRLALGQQYRESQALAFQRGRPNTDYIVRAGAGHTMTTGTRPNGTYNWKNVRKVLPFMPTEVYDQGDAGGGRHMYFYGGLRFLPGHARDAYPLNANSIVMAVDGVSYNAPRAFSSPLEYPAPGQRYVEVVYFQRGDVDGYFHRAYIPLLTDAAALADWNRMVDSNPMFQPNRQGLIRGAVAATFVARVLYELANSAAGQDLHRQYEECLRRQAQAQGQQIILC